MREGLKAQLSGGNDDWATPKYLLRQIEREFGKIDCDPCPLMYKKGNALFEKWFGNVFINPPYSNVENFLNKGLIELKKGNAKQLIFLIIPRTSTKYWKNFVMKFAEYIYFIPYRIKFGSSKSCAPFPSCIVIFKNLNPKKEIKCKIWHYPREKLKKTPLKYKLNKNQNKGE